MGVFLADYAWGRPGPAALKAAGVRGVLRYLSHDSSGKNLDKAEAKGLSDAGIDIGVVWESTTSRWLDGHAAGAQDARDAQAQAQACGMPADRPIFFAVDADATGRTAAVVDYLRGAASVLGASRTGVYGGLAAVRAAFTAGVVAWGWQTYAWSGGQWDSRAQIQQYSNDHLINGVGVDYDRTTKADAGLWRVGGQPAQKPPVTPTGPTPLKEELMYGQLNCGVGAVTPVSFKPGTYTAVGFVADAAVDLVVECQHGPNQWDIVKATYDPKKGKTVVHLPHPGTTDALKIRRAGAKGVGDDVPVGYDAS